MKKRTKNSNGKNGHSITTERDLDFLKIVPSVGLKTMFAAQEVMNQPLPRIAEELGKSEKELTPYDVMLFTYTNIPKAVRRAMFDATLEQFELWQSMVRAIPQHVPFPLSKK